MILYSRLVALPMCYGGFGIQQYQTTVSITYTSAKAASLLHLFHLGLLPPSDLPPPDLRAALRTMYSEQAAALRADLPIAYHSTYDDHCNKSSNATSPHSAPHYLGYDPHGHRISAWLSCTMLQCWANWPVLLQRFTCGAWP